MRLHGEIPGSERVPSFDATTGEQVWSQVYERTYKIAYPTGPRCTPFVDADRVYTFGAMGDFAFQIVAITFANWTSDYLGGKRVTAL